MSTTGSDPLSSNSSDCASAAEADAAARPIAPPTSVITPTWRSTMPRTRAGVGAERHAQADLARALRDGVGEHAVEADRGEQRREHGERRRQHADEAVEEDVLAHLLRQRLQVLDRQVRVEPRDTACGMLARSCSGSQRRAHVEVDARRCASSCRYGRKNSGGISSFTSLYFAFCTRPTISMSSVAAAAVVAHALADGVAAEVELLRERLVDDRDLRRAERVGAR